MTEHTLHSIELRDQDTLVIILDEHEMTLLDDGQEWYEPGDDVLLAGSVPTEAHPNPPFTLEVNDEIRCDNWMHWSDAPEWFKASIRQFLAS